jgi:uncharacterized surface protein with fasciclin (FAS1) repeats
MYKLLKNLFLLSCVVLFFGSCRKAAFDEYYGRPENLAPPIYQVLESRGNFTNLLAIIEKSGYKNTLSAAGYWTFFAPNDAAFQKYFTENNTSLDKISAATAFKMVTYCLVFNAFQTNHIADYQAPTGWVVNQGFKRRTAYYDGFYKIAKPQQLAATPGLGDSAVVLSSNRNGVYLFGDNNNKYIPYFYSTFMSARGLSATDYNYFFPNSNYTGFNVVDANVVTKDILAENGVIHEIDKVILPLPSLEQQLANNVEYAQFKRMFENFIVSYIGNPDATRRYNTLTNKPDNVYIKLYSILTAFALNNENYSKITDNDSQTDGYSIFAPTNAALFKYLNDVVLEFYKANPNDQLSNDEINVLLTKIPPGIITDFMNAHLWQSTVWPSKFNSTNNFLGEPARFDPTANVVEKKFCSNGVFYGTNQVQRANIFSTVYSRAYLDPSYSLMTRLINLNLRNTVTNPGIRFTVFMIPDVTLRTMGYDYNTATNQFTITVNGTVTSGNAPRDQLLRMLNLNIIPTQENELNNLAGSGVAESFGGEYIRWNSNMVSSAGSIERNETLTIDPSKTRDYSNGRVYFLTSGGVLNTPTGTIATQIARYSGTTAAPGPYFDFYQYLINSSIYNPNTQEIVGVLNGPNYTFLIPTRAAIQQAIRDGFLPGTVVGVTVTPTYNPTLAADRAKVTRFIQYHIADGISIAADGKKSQTGSALPSLLSNSIGDKLTLSIFNQPGNFTVQDYLGRQAKLVPANSNNLANRALLHQIDNYLRFNF